MKKNMDEDTVHKLTSSVALCTCNGEKFIREQIRSIVTGAVPVDEIIVCDDRSEDATLQILNEELAGRGIAYRIIVNDKRLGPGLNFQKCIGACAGDIVFLSDQDDVWKPDKVSRFLEAFRDEKIVCAFSDAEIIDSGGKITEYSLLSRMIPADHLLCAMTDLLPDTMARVQKTPNGCLMAIRRVPYLTVLNDPMCVWHDGWLFHAAAVLGEYAYINERLMAYRIHEDNLTSSQAKQIEYRNKIAASDEYDRYFGLHVFRESRVRLFRHIVEEYGTENRYTENRYTENRYTDNRYTENRYTEAYRTAVKMHDILARMKTRSKIRKIITLAGSLAEGCYLYRYYDPFEPAGLRFAVRLLHVFVNDCFFLIRYDGS